MELSDLLNHVLLPLGVLNQVILPCAILNNHSIPTSRLKVDFEDIYRYRQLPKEYDALDYANIASSLVHNYAEGKGVCQDYACSMFEVYRSLIFLNKKKKLKNKIRLAMGLLNSFWDVDGHMILEIDNGNGFFPYETMFKTPILDPERVKEYDSSQKINPLAVTFGHSFAGTNIIYPALWSLFYPGGFLRAWWVGFARIG